MVKVAYTEINTTIGRIVLSATGRGLCHVQFGSYAEKADELNGWLKRNMGEYELQQGSGHLVLEQTVLQLQHYFTGQSTHFDVPLDVYGTAFQKSVWQQLQQIEYGRTKSYKQIAEAIGNPKAVRAVGMANNRNPISIIIPCHRVIGHDGSLVGYGGGLHVKKALLHLEEEKVAGEICID